MSLSSETKKLLRESLQQQCLNQKFIEYNEAKKLFTGLTDLNYKHDHRKHTFYKYWLASNGHANKNDTALLDAYQLEEIYSKYIIRVAEKGYTVIDHLTEVYRISDTHECIDGNQPLCLIIDIDARQKPDLSNPELLFLDDKKITPSSSNANKCSWHIVYPYTRFIDYRELKGFTKKVIELVGEPYLKFIDVGLSKTRFSLQFLGSIILKSGHAEEEFKPINNDDALIKGANLCYRQKQYKPEHKSLSFDKVSDKVKSKEKSKWRLIERLPKAVFTPHQFSELPEESINVKEMEDVLDAFPDFLSKEPSITLIRSTVVKSILRLDFQGSHFCIAILDEVNAIMRQMASGVHVRKSSNAMRDLLNVTTHVVAMDAFANDSTLAFLKSYRDENVQVIDNKYQPRRGEIVKLLYDPDKDSEAIRKGFRMFQENKHVAFVMTPCKKARVLANQTSKLQKPDGSFILSQVYFGQIDGKQHQDDFTNIDATWSSLDCVIYTSTVEAGISFEISGYFDAVINITNIATLVHVEAFAQMLFRICDCLLHIVSLYYNKKFDIFKEPCQKLIQAELLALRLTNSNQRPALISSTGVTLELISIENTEKVNRKEVSHTIKNIEKKLKVQMRN
ncbi:hypothetical protein Glove_669g24 [Diversispora epigaea]|uniref:Replication origin-binding protein domain-containing protein n=1 Tax=Diversispora epigaea TaxID=1348612 RepID=A0A397G4Q0_9GLOM|nr:hypothetical protein Glove_669g24 [Diversispora epigaea]